MPVKSGNDANVAALGEMWQGGGKGYKNLVMVTLGTGVGGGIILNEKIWTGEQGVGGEIGHIHVMEGRERGLQLWRPWAAWSRLLPRQGSRELQEECWRRTAVHPASEA